MEKKDYLVIILPESMADVPVRVYCMENQEQFGGNQETDAIPICRRCRQPEYAFIWQYEGYLKVTLDEIQWIEARGSYSEIHLTGDRRQVVSFNLAVVMRSLPACCFIRIHRSYVVNLMHVRLMKKGQLQIGNVSFPVGREYRNKLHERIITIGVRRKEKE